MTDRIIAITDLIDNALAGNDTQHTSETSYGDDFGAGACWRCAEPAAEDSVSGLCHGCRAFLLEDTEVDPAAPDYDDFRAGFESGGLEPYGLEPYGDTQLRLPGPAPGTIEASFPGYAPITLAPEQWRREATGWDPGPVRFRHAGGDGGGAALIIGYWLSTGDETLWYTAFYQPVLLAEGGELEVDVTWPSFGSPLGPHTLPACLNSETVVRLFVDQLRRDSRQARRLPVARHR